MLMDSKIIAFCIAAFVLIVTPGPNFLYVLTRGATQGRRAGLIAACGLGAGVLIHTTLAAVGIAAIIRSSYLAFRAIKYGGSAYLVYLGITALRVPPPSAEDAPVTPDGDARVFWQSIVASMTNPKTILFFLSFLPQFVSGPVHDATRQMLVLGAIYMALTVAVYGTVAHFSGAVNRWLRAGHARAARLRWATATGFVGLGIWAALPERR
jgi:threonine/homoserine/homoserine lactone efflux protein